MDELKYSTILAVHVDNLGIGYKNKLPWHLKEDMLHFKLTTMSNDAEYPNIVIMGRRTWSSIPENMKPLVNRYNIVISSSTLDQKEKLPHYVAPSVTDAMCHVETVVKSSYHKVFLIGGANLFDNALTDSKCKTIYLTIILSRESQPILCDVCLTRPEWKSIVEHATGNYVGDILHLDDNINWRIVDDTGPQLCSKNDIRYKIVKLERV